MNRKLVLASVLTTLISCMPHPVSAHVLVKDNVTKAGAVLHVNPDDDPVAGKKAWLFFGIQDSSLPDKRPTATFTITDDQKNQVAVPTDVDRSGISAEYVFPRQGMYQLDLVITEGGKKLHEFRHNQRISRGITGSQATGSTPAWAQAGLLFAILSGAVAAIVAFNRRHDINKYSRF